MNSSAIRKSRYRLALSQFLALTCLIIVVASSALYVRSFSACDAIVLLDVGVTTDSGYVMFTVPLGKLTHDGVPQTCWKTARMENGSWIWPELQGLPFPTLSEWLETMTFETTGCWGKEFLGIGFWHGPELNLARRSPYITVYFPIPILAVGLLFLAYVGYRMHFRMSLKTLLALPVVVALVISCLTYLLTLRAA